MAKAPARENYPLRYALLFLGIWAVNALVLYVANMISPTNVVLGTMSLKFGWALALSSGVLAWLSMMFMPFVFEWEKRQGRDAKPQELIAFYLVANFIAIWLVSRVSEVFGLGVASWITVLLVAIVFDFLQGMVAVFLEKALDQKN